MAGFLIPCRSTVIRRQGTLETLVSEGHLVRFIWRVLSSLDFSTFEAGYRSVPGGPGRPAYHPRVLAALWIYGMTQGLETASAIAEAGALRDDFRWLAGGLCPSDQTLLNFLARGEEFLPIWAQVLQAMHRAGHVDLSVIFEDGTKLRADASLRSFHTAKEIEELIARLKPRLEAQLAEQAAAATTDRKASAKTRALQLRLARAEQAAEELRQRATHQSSRAKTPRSAEGATLTVPSGANPDERVARRFGRENFRQETDLDALLCPAGEQLRLIGRYPTDNGRGTYRLYGRRDCTGCALKERCTAGRGRRVKIVEPREELAALPEPPADSPSTDEDNPSTSELGVEKGKRAQRGPQASVTDPEAKLMLATSVKRWEPSYNADLAVTRDGVIVSQFLTKHSNDFHHFAPALETVCSTLGRPESWVGDGHYGTHANLLLAHRERVALYAPSPRRPEPATPPPPMVQNSGKPVSSAEPSADSSPAGGTSPRFRHADFRHDTERDVLVCPAGQELRFIGQYSTETSREGSYRLYGRRGCTGCVLKTRCTTGRGRRLKVHVARSARDDPEAGTRPRTEAAEGIASAHVELAAALDALQARMDREGDEMMKMRGHTVEPANAHLKQHGVQRFHVRGLDRCAAVLTLSCMAHNIMKWKAREVTQAMKLAA